MEIKINFKRATIQDVDKFVDLEKSVAGTSVYSAMTERQDAVDEITKNIVYFIEKENNIVGNISYEIKNDKAAYISGFMIAPQFQGQGIGKKAMEMILNELENMEEIDLVTHPHNTKALMLYLSLGFKIDSWKDNYFGDGEPRVRMVREQ
jgi:ribosomal protein S18 acetylase RimI-like enzyme